jgi:dUTP pyrophosphatase
MNFNVQFIHPDAKLPTRSTSKAMGLDLYCVADDEFKPIDYLNHNRGDLKGVEIAYKLYPGERHVFHTGFKAQIPDGYGVIYGDRSGNSVKRGLHYLGGRIDSDYRGEWMVCLINLDNYSHTIKPGDKIIQITFVKLADIHPFQVDKLPETDRGEKGFGSSGR